MPTLFATKSYAGKNIEIAYIFQTLIIDSQEHPAEESLQSVPHKVLFS